MLEMLHSFPSVSFNHSVDCATRRGGSIPHSGPTGCPIVVIQLSRGRVDGHLSEGSFELVIKIKFLTSSLSCCDCKLSVEHDPRETTVIHTLDVICPPETMVENDGFDA